MAPVVSSDQARVTTPARETRPYVPRSAQMPLTAAGMRSDPPVSVPVATGSTRAASAAPDPPLEPPGLRVGSHGLRVGGLEVP
jgi:hypothetical protein